MDIFVNDQKISVTLENERTLGDVLREVERNFSEQNATIVEIEVDGKIIESAAIDSMSQKPLEGVCTLKLRAVSAAGIVSALKDLLGDFSLLEQELPQIPVRLQSGKREESFATIQRFADTIDAFCRLTSLCALFPEFFASFKIDGKNPNEFFGELSPILNDFCAALESNDIVMMGDLAEYEISPRVSSLICAVEGLP